MDCLKALDSILGKTLVYTKVILNKVLETDMEYGPIASRVNKIIKVTTC